MGPLPRVARGFKPQTRVEGPRINPAGPLLHGQAARGR